MISGTARPGVAQALPQLARRPGGGRHRAQLRPVHRGQREDHRHKAGGIGEKADAVSYGGDEDAGNGRAHRAGHVDQDRVQADGVAQVVGPDELHHERLAGRVLEGVVQAEQRGEDADVPDLHRPGDGEQPQGQRLDSHGALERDHHPALVDAVGNDAPIGPQQQHRQGLQRDDHAQRSRGVGEGQHEP